MKKIFKILLLILITLSIFLVDIANVHATSYSISTGINSYILSGEGGSVSFRVTKYEDNGTEVDITGGPDFVNGFCIIPRFTSPTSYSATYELNDTNDNNDGYKYTTSNGKTIPLRAIVYYMYNAPGYSKISNLFNTYFGAHNDSTNNYRGYSLMILSYVFGRVRNNSFFGGYFYQNDGYNYPENEWYKYDSNGNTMELSESVKNDLENKFNNILNTIANLYETDKSSMSGFKVYYMRGTSSSFYTQDVIFWDNTFVPAVKGALKIKKEFINGNEDFSKIQFQIKNTSGTVLDTITPNSSGYACYGYTNNSTCSGEGKLDIGSEYIVTEVINSSDDLNYKWVALSNNIRVVIKKDSDKTSSDKSDVVFKNRKKLYCVAVKKVDAEDTTITLSGVSFKIGDTVKTTNDNGIATFTNLDYKGYTIVETTAKDGYWNDEGNISVKKSDLTEMTYNESSNTYSCPSATVKTYTKKDYKKYNCVKVKKVDSVTNTILKGATFNINIKNNNGEYIEHSDNWDGKLDGYTTFFTETRSGTFKVQETIAPAGYSLYSGKLDATTFTLPSGLTRSEAINECKNVTCNYNANTNKDVCKYQDNTAIDEITVDSIPSFPDSRYLINWYKETEDGSLASGAQFKIKNPDGNYIYQSGKVTVKDENNVSKSCYVFSEESTGNNSDIFVSDTNGEVCVVGVIDAKYNVVETKPAKYHTFSSVKSKVIRRSTSFNSKTTDNTYVNYKTVFTFTKTVTNTENEVFSQITTAQLQKIAFNVYKLDSTGKITGNPLSFIKTSSGTYEFSSNTIDPKTGDTVSDLYLNNDRKIIIYHLEYGDYGIIEKGSSATCDCASDSSNCTGFYSPSYSNVSDYKFTIDECSNVDASCSSNKNVTQTLSNVPTEIKFTKSDLYQYEDATDTVKFENEEEVKAFDRIKFRLYTKDESGNKQYVSLVKVNDTCGENTKYAEYRNVSLSLTSNYNLTTTKELYTCNGNIKITHLCRGKTYYIEEVEVPTNSVFTLPESEADRVRQYNIPCCGDTTTSTLTKAVINDKPTRVVIYKLDSRTNEKVDDETTTFVIYQCKSDVTSCSKENGSRVYFTKRSVIEGDMEDSGKEVYKYSKTDSGFSALHPYKGEVILRYLPAGYKYVAVETIAPDGYYIPTNENNSTQFTVRKDTVNVPIINVSNDYVRIYLNKTDIYGYYSSSDKARLDSDEKLLDTAKFVLRDETGTILKLKKVQDGEYRYIKVDSNNTIEKINTYNGVLKITHLERGKTYYIEEVETTDPNNFILPTNIKKPSGIPSGWDWKGHPYKIYNVPENIPSDASVTQIIANKPTRVVFHKTDKRTGELILDETTTFVVYQCKLDEEVCTKNNGTRVYFSQRKVIEGDEEDSNNEVYRYSKTGSGFSALHPYNGQLILRYLPADYKYVLVETIAPNGYYSPDEEETEFTVKETTIDENNDYEILTENIVNTPTEIVFIKSDFYKYYTSDDIAKLDSDVRLLDTAKFVLRDENGKVLKLTKVDKNDEEGNVYKYEEVNGSIQKISTYKGKLKITNLIRGKDYYIEEIETTNPGNLVLKNIEYSQPLPFDNKGHQVVKYTLPETSPLSAITREISNKPTRVRFEKRDSKYNYLILDETTTFRVYQCKKGVECHPSDGITSDMTLINFEPRSVIEGDEDDMTDAEGLSGVEVYKYKKLNKDGITDLHPYNGILVLRYLPSDYEYVLLEVTAPKNYNLPIGTDAETRFTVSSETAMTQTIDRPNVPTSLIIRKYDDNGNLLEGAQFKIYEGTTCDASLSPMNQPKTLLKLKTIRDGVYENRPVADTDIIQTCSNANGACNNIKTNELTQLTYNSYIGSWADFSNQINEDEEAIEINQGEILVQYLEYGHCYIIEEVKAPKGYSLPKKEEDRYTMVVMDTNEKYVLDTHKQLINKPTPFTFYKYDEYGKALDGAEFKLQILDDNKKYKDVAVIEENVNDELFYKATDDGENKIMTTKNGKATIYYLKSGQYRILEVKQPEGKELSKNGGLVTFFVDDSGNVHGNSIIVNKAKTEKIEIKGSSSAEVVIAPKTGQVVIKYGLLIAILSTLITGLMILVRKMK